MITTRFAPSPTGYLHIGGLRTALFNYLYARANGGRFLLRIEDTDFNRNSIDAAEAIIEAFGWVGLNYDNAEIIYQSKRLDIYRQYAQILLDKGLAYHCYMSKDELDALRETQRKNGQTPRYDNRYRDFSGTPPSGITPCVRIKAPLSGEIRFIDALKGEISINATELDDFIIMRSDGTPTYNFVVAVDDALMEISDIIRGDDHLSNTPKQIIIYNALGFGIPRFCHIPMILNPQGKKLSKRDGALNVMEYKTMGILPEALLNFLLRLGFGYEDKEIFSIDEMIKLFSLEHLGASASAYNESKLLWLNNHYIRETSNARIVELVEIPALQNAALSAAQSEVLFKEVKERISTLVDLRAMIEGILQAPQSYDEKACVKIDGGIKNLLPSALESISEWQSAESIAESLHNFAESKGIKVGKILGALRVALLGGSGGVGINELLFIIGRDEAERRVKVFLAR